MKTKCRGAATGPFSIEGGLVSVLLPVRNGMRYLCASLSSLQQQTYRCLEILVIDDGSDDGTWDYLQSLSDPKIRILKSAGRGIATALNTGLAQARGEYVARHDADDLSHPERIERQISYIRAHPDIGAVASCVEFIDSEGNLVETEWTRAVRQLHDFAETPEQIRKLLPLTCCLVHGSVFLPRPVLLQAGGYCAKFAMAQDYDLWLRLLPHVRLAKLRQRLYLHRIHPEQVSNERREEQTRWAIRAKLEFLRRCHPFLPRPTRMVIQGNGPGVLYYQEIAPEYGLHDVSSQGHAQDGYRSLLAEPNGATGCDLFIVTEFALIEQYDTMLNSAGCRRWMREGNFFLNVRNLSHR